MPAPLDAIVMKCLEKEPNRRYDSAKALREDLQCFLDGKPIHARPPGVLENVHFWIRQHIFASRVSGSVVLVLLLSVAALIFNLSRERNALKKEVMEMEHLILSQASRVTSSLRVHTGEQQLKVTQDVSAQMASELYALGNLRLAARCAAEAIVAGAVLGEPAPEHLADMVHEYYRDQTVADDVSLLELAERLLDDSMAEQYALPHVPEDDSQVPNQGLAGARLATMLTCSVWRELRRPTERPPREATERGHRERPPREVTTSHKIQTQTYSTRFRS